MLSSKGVTDVKREKMKEEAMKERAKKAKAANILYKDKKIRDVGFVTRKVAPNTEDRFSTSLKDGLIDYRVLLGTKDYRYLGIDDVPGTPEVNDVNFEDAYRRAQPSDKHLIHNKQPLRLNGFKKETIIVEASKPVNQKPKASAEYSVQKSVNEVKDRKPKDSQTKPKPPVLAMPEWSKPSPVANDTNEKLSKTHPSKIESILKEMIDIAPPLTDIQTPVKTQDTTFPFPHMPPVKEPLHPSTMPGKQSFPVKTEEILKNDLITTSDDDSDDEAHHIDHSAIVKGTSASHLSASSSSSSEGSSSDSSGSDSESDSETEAKTESSIPKKNLKTRTPMKPNKSKTQISDTHSTPNQTHKILQRNSTKGSSGGKVIRNEICEKQVSPLNSVAKESRKEQSTPPAEKAIESLTDKKQNHVSNGLKTHPDLPLHPQFANEYFDSLNFDPLFDEIGPLFGHNSGIEAQSDLSVANDNLDSITDIMNLGQMHPSFDNSLHVNMQNSNLNFPNDSSQMMQMVNMDNEVQNMKSGRPGVDASHKSDFYAQDEGHRLTLPDDVCDSVADKEDAFEAVTVDMSVLSNWTNDIGDNSYFQNMPSKGSKKTNDLHLDGKSAMLDDSMDRCSNNARKTSTSTPLQVSQSKKTLDDDWFINSLSKGKKYDLPYVNPDKLKFVGAKDSNQQNTSKAPINSSLKVKISLDKIKGKLNDVKDKPHRSSPVKVASKAVAGDDKPASNKKIKNRDATASKNRDSTGTKNRDTQGTKSSTTKNRDDVGFKKSKKKADLKPSRAVGKDIETIKRLMAESGNKPSDDDEVIDVVGTPSPCKKTPTPQARVSGKVMKQSPISSSLKKDFTKVLTPDREADDIRTKSSESNTLKPRQELKPRKELKHVNKRKRTRSSDSFEDSSDSNIYDNNLCARPFANKQRKATSTRDDRSVQDMDIEDGSSDVDIAQNATFHHKNAGESEHGSKMLVKIDLFRLSRLPRSENYLEKKLEISCMKDEEMTAEVPKLKEENPIIEPVWKPPPNIKIPKITKRANEVASKQVKNCTSPQAEHSDSESSCNNSTNYKPTKDVWEKKTKGTVKGRGVKRKDERPPKNANQNPNVCGMCGTLQKDTGRDPIRLGTYKTSYVEFLSMGKRNKRRADCLDPSERAPEYIDAVLKYIKYLVGLEITGKINTKKGVEEYMCIASQCIDLVGYVINQYGKKENNNITSFDDRSVFLCLRLQSVLYFKLFAVKKDSASRYAKVLSEYFRVRRSPHHERGMKGSTGTPSPMSPTSSQNGSVASFGSAGSSASSGSYDKMSNGNMVSIPSEMFEKMQQYFTYTKYILHGQRLWDDAESIAVKCQEFIGVVSRRIGALTMQSSLLHLVDYISTGLDIIKDNQS